MPQILHVKGLESVSGSWSNAQTLLIALNFRVVCGTLLYNKTTNYFGQMGLFHRNRNKGMKPFLPQEPSDTSTFWIVKSVDDGRVYYRCTVDGCGKDFDSESAVRSHQSFGHRFRDSNYGLTSPQSTTDCAYGPCLRPSTDRCHSCGTLFCAEHALNGAHICERHLRIDYSPR